MGGGGGGAEWEGADGAEALEVLEWRWLLWCGGDAMCAKFLSLFGELSLKLVDLMKLLCFDLGWLNG